jgi:leucyl-tRNA synthetase
MIDKVSGDYERMKFNTAIAALMGYVNEVSRTEGITRGEMRILLSLLHPVAPHVTEEMRVAAYLDPKPFHQGSWPVADASYLVPDNVEIAVQVNGRIVARIHLPSGLSSDEAGNRALAVPEVANAMADRPARRIVCVPDRLVNIVV